MIEYIFTGIVAAIGIYIIICFRPARTAEIADNLYVVNSVFVNFYAYNSGGDIMLFDSGISAALARRSLQKLGLSPDKVTRVFLTHTDFDHKGGLSAFPNAEVFISDAEEQMINGQTTRRGIMRNRLSRNYKTLKDGEIVKHGEVSVKLILTPGHTPGSSSYLINDRILVTGDLLRLARNGSIKPFLRLMNKNYKQDAKTVEAMRGTILKAAYVLTGHTGVRTKDATERSKDYAG